MVAKPAVNENNARVSHAMSIFHICNACVKNGKYINAGTVLERRRELFKSLKRDQ